MKKHKLDKLIEIDLTTVRLASGNNPTREQKAIKYYLSRWINYQLEAKDSKDAKEHCGRYDELLGNTLTPFLEGWRRSEMDYNTGIAIHGVFGMRAYYAGRNGRAIYDGII